MPRKKVLSKKKVIFKLNPLIFGFFILGIILGVFIISRFFSREEVYFISDTGTGDKSFNDVIFSGIKEDQQKYNYNIREFTGADVKKLDSRFASQFLLKKKPAYVVIAGNSYEDRSTKWASLNPHINFLLLDQEVTGFHNVKSVKISAYGGSYLAGVLASAHSKSNKVGILLGMESPVMTEFLDGFTEGVRSESPYTFVTKAYLSTTPEGFNDVEGASQSASKMYANGVDVIYAVAGKSNLGVFESASSMEGRFAIGVDTDQSSLAPEIILGSVVKKYDVVVKEAIEENFAKNYKAGFFTLGLKDGASGLVLNPKFSDYSKLLVAARLRLAN
jgi:basic membrane protein A